ncbi:hypothetical protein DD630_33510 [Streptomyces sp. BSE7F]|nr:hypothetical protein DD630_33510 [Streptomyces sp. BSE7F]
MPCTARRRKAAGRSPDSRRQRGEARCQGPRARPDPNERPWAGTGTGDCPGRRVPPPLGDMYARLPCPGRLTGLRITGPKRRTRAAVAGPLGERPGRRVEGKHGRAGRTCGARIGRIPHHGP